MYFQAYFFGSLKPNVTSLVYYYYNIPDLCCIYARNWACVCVYSFDNVCVQKCQYLCIETIIFFI